MSHNSYYNKIEHTYSFMKDMFESNESKYYRDYIDYLEQRHVPKNIMKGKDLWGRKFITIKVGIQSAETGKLLKTAQVFFQRYSNDDRLWAGADFEGEFLNTSGGLSLEQHELLDNIISGRKIVLKEAHRCKKKHIGSVIASMDVWELEAAQCIKRNWLIAYYNPKYSIRKNILNRQFDEYLKHIDD